MLYSDMTPAQRAEIDRQEDEREARKSRFNATLPEDFVFPDYNDSILPEDWNPADFVFVSPEDQAGMLSDEAIDAMCAEHEEEMVARAEMESGVLYKSTFGEWM